MCTPLSVGGKGGGVQPPTKFSKRGGLDRTSTSGGGCWERGGVTFFRGGGCNFHIKKLKSEVFNDKKSLLAKIFFSAITKNSHWTILPNNLVSYLRI